MQIIDTSRAAIKAELREWYALAEEEANSEANTFPSDHTAADAAWLASLNADHHTDEPTPVELLTEPGDEWDSPEWDRWVWEAGECDEPDSYFDELAEQRFGTVHPSGWPTDEDMPWFRSF